MSLRMVGGFANIAFVQLCKLTPRNPAIVYALLAVSVLGHAAKAASCLPAASPIS